MHGRGPLLLLFPGHYQAVASEAEQSGLKLAPHEMPTLQRIGLCTTLQKKKKKENFKILLRNT